MKSWLFVVWLPVLFAVLFITTALSSVNGLAAANRNRSRQKKNSNGVSGGGGFGAVTNKRTKLTNPSTKTTVADYAVDTSESTKALLDFLDQEECEGLEVTEVGICPQTKLRGIFAKESIQPGEYICAVPFVSTLLIDETFVQEELEQQQQQQHLLSSSGRMNHGLSFINKFLHDSEKAKFFKAYLDCLPEFSPNDPNFDPTPEFWSEDEIQQLEIPSLMEDMTSRKMELQALALTENVNSNELLHASWIVRTRAFTTLKKAMTIDGMEGLLQRTVLIPYFDLINHSLEGRGANAQMQVVETKEYNESFYALIANKYIPKGQEIRITYGTGKESSLDIFAKYGFVPQDNIVNDQNLEEDLLSTIEWSTTLQEDEEMLLRLQELEEENEPSRTMKTILSLRTDLKRLKSITKC